MKSEILTLLMNHGKDMEWFLRKYDRLVEKYDGKFVAVYERKVVDCDESLDRLIERVSDRFLLERVIIEYVSKEKPLLVL